MSEGLLRRLGVTSWSEAPRELVAGAVTSLVAVAYCLSFGALVFSGNLETGFAALIWGFMAATATVTLLAGSVTTLPPMLAAPRNPVVAVMAVLAATVTSACAARGLSNAAAAQHVLVALSLATLLTGISIWVLGYFRLGQIVRFVPYPVIAGFIAASGWLLVIGGLSVARGGTFSAADLGAGLAGGEWVRIVLALVLLGMLLGLQRTRLGAGALPVAVIIAAVVLDLGLWLFGVGEGWYLRASSGPQSWSPLTSLDGIDWSILAGASVEIASIAAVSVVSLLLDVTTLEVQRRGAADMDREFEVMGASNIAIGAVGGLSVGFSIAPSRLIDALGGRTRLAGLAAGAALGLILISGVDIAGLVPRPVLGGLLVYLGFGLLKEALKAPGRRSLVELALSVAIFVAIIWLGYLTGIVLGVVGACLLFAASYSRIGVVQRHVTRRAFAAPVERAPDLQRQLTEQGERIHVLWLGGFVFFGSSNGLYEEIKRVVGNGHRGRRRWVVLDCGRVTGVDASAVLSLQKLANWAAGAGVTLAFADISAPVAGHLAAAGITGSAGAGRVFPSRNEALEWCEDELIADLGLAGALQESGAFEAWLGRELGEGSAQRLVGRFLERRTLKTGEVVCALGAPADTIELVAEGSVAVVVPGLGQKSIRVRRMRGHTVVGEMGFFRGLPRAASVMAEEPTVVYQMSREAYERLVAEEPLLCARFLEFVVRALAHRVDAANREITALV